MSNLDKLRSAFKVALLVQRGAPDSESADSAREAAFGIARALGWDAVTDAAFAAWAVISTHDEIIVEGFKRAKLECTS